MFKHLSILLLSLMLLIPPTITGEESTDPEIQIKIRDQGMYYSEIMRTVHYLTDVYGPRLTGSPNLKAAGEWAIRQMHSWGLQNGHLEPWNFGHPGWLNERLSAHILSPVKDHLVCEALAWTPSTNGTVTAQAWQLVPPERPAKADLDAYLEGVKENVRNKIVLVGKHQVVPVTLNPAPRRRDDQQTRAAYDPRNPNAGQSQGPRRAAAQPERGRLSSAQIDAQIDEFLLASGARLRVNDAARDHGQIRAFSNRTYDPTKSLPTVVMRNEDYGRISRLLGDGAPVELEFNILNRIYPEGRTAYNVVAEIPGTDKKDEVVMLGGHLDSWHAATGATDNAIGCAVMMEAARILQSLKVKPRRTIRVALWSGEEQGILGSQAYVKEHFGSFEDPKPAFFKFAGYLNIDSGTGRARGASVFGPPEAAAILRQALTPFEDLGVMGVVATKSRRIGGTDSTSFNNAGLPGIGLGQDPIEYQSYTWHTNLDTYERIIEDDAKKSAIAIAAAVYHLAMRDQLLPRFRAEEMPPAPVRQPAAPTETQP